MAIARTTLAFLGTDESTGVTIATTASTTGSEVDILGDNTSAGELFLYLVFTSTVTAGTVDVYFNGIRVTGATYAAINAQWSRAPISGTQKMLLGLMRSPRFASVKVLNNATGANITNVAVLGELLKYS